MNVWKFGSAFTTSLQAASAALGIPSKSESIDGKTLFSIPIKDMNWVELTKYCKEDVYVCYKIFKYLEMYV